MRSKLFICAALAGLAAFAGAQWTDSERSAIREALRIGNLVEGDLSWDRQPTRDPFRMVAVSKALENPLEAADQTASLSQALNAAAAPTILRLADPLFGLTIPADLPPTLPAAGSWTGPAGLRAPVVRLMEAITRASLETRASIANLTDEERRQLIESLPALAAEEFTPELDFVKQRPLPPSRVFELIQKVNHRRILRAAVALAEEVDLATRAIRDLEVNLPRHLELRVYGRVVRIYGRADDVHTETDASLTIDLGGDDVYRGRHGAGVGYAAVLLDLGGDDRYEPRDLSVGAGLLGIGIARDERGDDVYRGKSLCFGAALGGVGLLIDADGDDEYKARTMSQGFSTFGVAALLDAKGSDRYDVGLLGQGAARSQGVGILVDRAGRDIYRAGGLGLNSPLFEDVHYSFAQGFGMGYREDTGGQSGGVGLLVDGGGDDHYLAETYAQGASYWYGLGALWDKSGHDTYSAYHYAQASAMHCTAAFLFDLAGDDAYALKFGAGHAIGHDYGVAVLLDRAGSDVYSARDSNPSVGNANGLALFVDAAGDDRYAGPPGRGNPARDSGSLGVFVDMSGQDRYREGLSDAAAAVTNTWGIAWDRETPRARPGETPARMDPPVPGSLPLVSEAELSEIYRKATQWGVGIAQREVEENVNRLIGMGLPAFEWMLEKRLNRADRLQLRAFSATLRAIGQKAKEAVAAKVATGNVDEKRNGLSLAVEHQITEVAPLIVGLIDNPSLRLQAVRAAGALKSKESVQRLLPLTRESSGLGLAAMISLSQIGDEAAFSTAENLVTIENLPMRQAALGLLSKFPTRASGVATRLLGEREERAQRIGLELLGAIGTPDALQLVAERLLDPMPGLRIQALLVLNGRCPEDKRLTMMSLRTDPDPVVRAIAARVDPGR